MQGSSEGGGPVDLATFAPFTPVITDPAGSWIFSMGVPGDPNLAGLQVVLQMAIFGTAGPLGLDLSNGLVETVGF